MTTLYLLLPAVAQPRPWDGMWGWGWMRVAGLFSLLLLVVLVVAAALVATRAGRTQPPDPTARAREILNERYARGEISTEEYRERLETLR